MVHRDGGVGCREGDEGEAGDRSRSEEDDRSADGRRGPKGTGKMQPYKDKLTDAQIKDSVAYFRTFDQVGCWEGRQSRKSGAGVRRKFGLAEPDGPCGVPVRALRVHPCATNGDGASLMLGDLREFKEFGMTKIDSFMVVLAAFSAGRFYGLRSIVWRSGIQSQLPELPRNLGNAEPRNREDDGREGDFGSGRQEAHCCSGI